MSYGFIMKKQHILKAKSIIDRLHKRLSESVSCMDSMSKNDQSKIKKFLDEELAHNFDGDFDQLEYILDQYIDVKTEKLYLELILDRQYTILPTFDQTLVSKVISTPDNIDNVILNYFANDVQVILKLLAELQTSKILNNYLSRINESFELYKNDCFELASLSLVTVADGFLYELANSLDIVNSKIRHVFFLTNTIRCASSSQVDLNDLKSIFYLFTILKNFNKSIFANKNSKKDDSSFMYRDWLVHGCYSRRINKADFLKIITWLHAMSSFDLLMNDNR